MAAKHRAASPPQPDDDPRPLGGYAVLMAGYFGLSAAAIIAARLRGGPARPLRLRDLVIVGLATQHYARLLAKDSITGFVRAPFTDFVEATGEGEVNETVTGHGLAHAVGELLTCPFCLGQWVATALVAGRYLAPTATDAAISVGALARVADFLQIAYDRAKP